MPNLRAAIIKLAHAHPEFRSALLPVLTKKKAGTYNAMVLVQAVKGLVENLHGTRETLPYNEIAVRLVVIYEQLGFILRFLGRNKLKGMLTQEIVRNQSIQSALGDLLSLDLDTMDNVHTLMDSSEHPIV